MTKEQEVLEGFAQWVDDQFDFKELVNGLGGQGLEMIDGMLFKAAIVKGFSYVPDEQKETVLGVLESVVKGDVDSVADGVIETVVMNINSPLNDVKERIILSGLWEIIFDLIEESRK